MPKSKPFKPVKMWAVVDERGRMVEEAGFQLLFRSKRGADENSTFEERVVRVEIREVAR